MNNEQRAAAGKALQTLEVFRTMDPDMPIGQVTSFLYIAIGQQGDSGGLTVTELGERGGFALASASRHMKALGEKDRHGKQGQCLVTDFRDPLDDRRKMLRLSPKGYRIMEQLTNILGVQHGRLSQE